MSRESKKIEFVCRSNETRRGYIQRPFSLKNNTYATNCFVILRIPGKYALPLLPEYENIDDHISKFDFSINENWKQVHIDPPKCEPCEFCHDEKQEEVKCPECYGEGVIECEECGHEHECDKCEGTGKIITKHNRDTCLECNGTGYYSESLETVLIGNRPFLKTTIRFLYDHLPEIVFYPESKPCDKGILFVFDGGVGLVMESAT